MIVCVCVYSVWLSARVRNGMAMRCVRRMSCLCVCVQVRRSRTHRYGRLMNAWRHAGLAARDIRFVRGPIELTRRRARPAFDGPVPPVLCLSPYYVREFHQPYTSCNACARLLACVCVCWLARARNRDVQCSRGLQHNLMLIHRPDLYDLYIFFKKKWKS